MWSYFSRDPIANFAFDVGAVVDELDSTSVWRLLEGKQKTSGDAVSIFGFDVKSGSETQLEIVRAAAKRLKTLRHPNVVAFVDAVENANIVYVATERVTPLSTKLEELKKNVSALSWGIHQIAKALDFLNNSCGLVHNNVNLGAVFVDKAGEWKLGGVEFMFAETSGAIPPIKILPALEKYEPPERSVAQPRRKEKWSTDMWGLGCLIWEIFNGPLPRNAALKSPGKIPKSLVTNYCELVSANPCSRPNPADLLESCRRADGFMANSFVDTMLFIEQIQIKDAGEKSRFFGTLTDAVDSFPDDVCRHKILPQLLNAYEFAGAGSAVLPPLFKLSRLLSEDEYQKQIVPSVVKLFSSSDRTTRVRLLQQCELFIKHLQVGTVNEKIFPQVVHGFMDTNPTVREHTIKAMVFMAEKLNYHNLNEELMKHFARLQSRDDQGGIRTNTTVCLGKIAGFLNPERRQKVLVSAFCRALRDPFPPARQAGVLALAATHNYYTLNDGASKIIPSLAIAARDPEKAVRDQAFKAIKLFLGKLERVSEHPEEAEELEKDVNSGNVQKASAVASWAGWAIGGVGSLTSKIYSKNSSPASATAAPLNKNGTTTPASEYSSGQSKEMMLAGQTDKKLDEAISNRTEGLSISNASGPPRVKDGWDDQTAWEDLDGKSPKTAPSSSAAGWNDFENDAWEDFGDLSSQPDNPPASSLHPSKSPSPAATKASSEWDSEEFAPFDSGDDAFKPASSYDWGPGVAKLDPDSDSFFDALPSNRRTSLNLVPGANSKSSSPKPTETKTTRATTPSKKNADDDGWGDWDKATADDVSNETALTSKAELMRQKREQRRLEMEKKKAAKSSGAMKLGAKKM